MADFVTLIKDQWTSIPAEQTDVTGKAFIVTGSNTGLGFHAAEELVRNGASKVYLAVRTVSKGEAAEQRIATSTGRKDATAVLQLDMSNRASIEEFIKTVARLDRIDGVIANAALAIDKYIPAEGIESTLYVNVIATMLLVKELLPILQRSKQKHNITPFISIVGSEMALFREAREGTKVLHTESGDVYDIFDKAPVDGNRYPITKLLLLWCVRQFTAENPLEKTGVVINYTNPGLCWSDLGRDAALLQRVILNVLRYLLARSTPLGSHILVMSALAGPQTFGKYMTNGVVHEDRLTDTVIGPEGQKLQARVWADTQKRF